MTKLKTILVDDEQINLKVLETLLEKHCPNVEIIGRFSDPAEAIEGIQELRPDMVFADIEMPTMSGVEMIRSIPEVDFDVVFITAHNNYAVDAFKVAAIDYIVKPPQTDAVKIAVDRVAEKRRSNVSREQLNELITQIKSGYKEKPRLALNTHEKIFFVNLEEIVRCEASGVYTVFHLMDGKKHMVSKNIQKFEDLLEEHGFYRPHRSHIINLEYVKEFVKEGEGHLLMADGSRVEVSRYRKEEILKKLGR